MSAIDQSIKMHPSNGDGQGQEQLLADFKLVLADAEALLKATANQGGEKLDELRARVRESLRLMNGHLATTQQAIGTRAREAAKATDSYVHEHPWASIGIASGAALLFGLLLRGR